MSDESRLNPIFHHRFILEFSRDTAFSSLSLENDRVAHLMIRFSPRSAAAKESSRKSTKTLRTRNFLSMTLYSTSRSAYLKSFPWLEKEKNPSHLDLEEQEKLPRGIARASSSRRVHFHDFVNIDVNYSVAFDSPVHLLCSSSLTCYIIH